MFWNLNLKKKTFLEDSFINTKGFSLIEMIVVMGVLAIASMGAMQLMVKTTKITKTSEIGMEINAVVNSITQNLLSSDGCSNTFKDVGVIEEDVLIEEIKNRTGQVIFDKEKKYGNNRLKISEMYLEGVTIKEPQEGVTKKYGEFKLQIKLEKLGKNFYGQKFVTKSLPLQGEFDLENNLTKCYSATEDAVYTAKKDSCEDIGGTWDLTNDTCELNDSVGRGVAASTQRVEELLNDLTGTHLPENYVNKAGDTMSGQLTINSQLSVNGSASAQILNATQKSNSPEFCIGNDCRNTFAKQVCAGDEVQTGINPDGTVTCRKIECDSNRLFQRLNADGTTECIPLPIEDSCPANQVVKEVRVDAQGKAIVVCEKPRPYGQNCTIGQYVEGMTTVGDFRCRNLPSEICSTKNIMRKAGNLKICKSIFEEIKDDILKAHCEEAGMLWSGGSCQRRQFTRSSYYSPGWSSYDDTHDKRCTGNRVFYGMHSNFDGSKKDRTFMYHCGQPITSGGGTYSSSSVGMQERLNEFDMPLNFECPYPRFIYQERSYHDSNYEDRRFRFGCRELKWKPPGGSRWLTIVPTNCQLSRFINSLKQNIKWTCPGNKMITGWSSYHDNSSEDRRTAITCCDMQIIK